MKATPKEKALIFALAAGHLESWKDVYLLARKEQNRKKEAKPESVAAIVSRYKQREEIRQAYQEARQAIQDHDDKIRAAALEEARREMMKEKTPGDSEHPATRKAAGIDYYNPENQRETINKIIQSSADDPKTQLDAIKVIQQTQRDDRQAAKDNQIQRFFTPVTCQICPLYAKKARK